MWLWLIIYAGAGVGVVVELAGGEGGEDALTGSGEGTLTGGVTGRVGGLAASGLIGRAGVLAEGVDALAGAGAGAGAITGAAMGRATTGEFAPVGADDTAEVELLPALPSTAAAVAGVAEEEGIAELLEDLFEGIAPGVTDWGGDRMLARRPSRAD